MSIWLLTGICLVASTLEPILIKLGYLGSATPPQLLVVRGLVAGICALPFIGKISPTFAEQFGRILPVCVIFVVTNVFLMLAFAHLPVSIVVALVTSTPAFVALVNQWRGTVALGQRFWIGFILCFVGIPATVGSGFVGAGGTEWKGLIYVGLAIAGSTLYRTRMDMVTRHVRAIQVSGCLFLFCGLTAALCAPFFLPLPETAVRFGAAVGMTSVVANVTFLATLASLGSTRVSMIGLLQRPTVVVASAVALHEPLTLSQMAGIALVMTGVYLAKPEPIPQRQQPHEQA
ncbi:DMT family transporter [Aquincola sp. S2]|uniref:DMT family transporter n=1 Tax=Pseudaquabacterium terrae TaxID=2732868 RepID=A0ABX2EBK7_9BURK|nr:DMT family transporter [Aquabacterium terrae]NRF65921.1 DMT family transporter [Aquabacterium terrae]